MNQEQSQPDEQLSSSLWDDPVVEEVRAIRRRLWDASGRDVQRFIEQTREADQRRAAEGPRHDAR